jgi:hypothetical protein
VILQLVKIAEKASIYRLRLSAVRFHRRVHITITNANLKKEILRKMSLKKKNVTWPKKSDVDEISGQT